MNKNAFTPVSPAFYPSALELPYRPQCAPMDGEWKARIASLWWGSSFDEQSIATEQKERVLSHRELIRIILGFAGEEVCMAMPEPDLEELKLRGVFLYGNTARLKKMKASACHWNCAALFLAEPEKMLLMTGYALSIDGCWRQHSWCIDLTSGTPVETTTCRIGYFGFVMSAEEAADFCRRHPPGA